MKSDEEAMEMPTRQRRRRQRQLDEIIEDKKVEVRLALLAVVLAERLYGACTVTPTANH